jgi:double-strand break repair protein MRE11
MDDIVLSSEEVDLSETEQLIEYLANKVEEMISKALEDIPPTMNKATTKPLIRLKVEYSGFSTVNPSRFGQRFVGRVANPNEILLFHRKRVTTHSLCFFLFFFVDL